VFGDIQQLGDGHFVDAFDQIAGDLIGFRFLIAPSLAKQNTMRALLLPVKNVDRPLTNLHEIVKEINYVVQRKYRPQKTQQQDQ
jgi:hypothetical protein